MICVCVRTYFILIKFQLRSILLGVLSETKQTNNIILTYLMLRSKRWFLNTDTPGKSYTAA